MMKLYGLVAALLCAATCIGTVSAGPNAGGTLIISLSEGWAQSLDVDGCDASGLPDCESAITNAPAGTTPVMLHVLAAFHLPGGRLSGVVWGVGYDPEQVSITDHGPCGDFELSDANWPASGSGTAITWFSPQVDRLVPVYWFAAYGDDGAALNLGPHPRHGGQFGDDSIPSMLDEIAGFGSMGFGVNPGSVVCPVPTGACCYPDGTCEITTAPACGGVYQGDEVACDPNPCPDTITGACCFPDATCLELSDGDCASQGGFYQGDGSLCDPNPCPWMGACCSSDGTCELTTEAACGGTYQGDGTGCDPNPCPVMGACCFPDGTCQLTTEEDCGGVYEGDGTLCNPNPCPDTITGACCFPDATCQELNDRDCARRGGIYQGDASVCDPNPCPWLGACCFPDGTCELTSEAECDGVYGGDGTTCDPNPCSDTIVGACCFPDVTCQEMNDADCADAGGDYQGDGIPCDPGLCPLWGACCYPSGQCVVKTEEDCAATGGIYQGDSVPCDPTLCPHTGFCCLPDGVCIPDLTTEECEKAGGMNHGIGIGCDPQPCQATPVLERSWGAIKHQYRSEAGR